MPRMMAGLIGVMTRCPSNDDAVYAHADVAVIRIAKRSYLGNIQGAYGEPKLAWRIFGCSF